MSYNKADLLATATRASVGNVELDVLTVTDGAKLKDSQLSIYLKGVLGASTELAVRYYFRREVGGDWFLLPYKNETTGALTDLPSLLSSANLQTLDSIPMPACFAFKITVKGNNATATASLEASVMSRDN